MARRVIVIPPDQGGSVAPSTPIGHAEHGRDDDVPDGGHYCGADVARLVAHAATGHVTLVPGADLPGRVPAVLAACSALATVGEPLSVATRWGISPHVLAPRPAPSTPSRRRWARGPTASRARRSTSGRRVSDRRVVAARACAVPRRSSEPSTSPTVHTWAAEPFRARWTSPDVSPGAGLGRRRSGRGHLRDGSS